MAEQNVSVTIAGQAYTVAVSIGGSVPMPTGWYSATAYGAVGNGVTDDTGAINAAIAAAAAAGGGRVHLPSADYAANQIAMKSRVWLTAENGARILKAAGSVGDTNNAINMIGTVTATSSALTANATAGAGTVAVTNGALFSAGDWCLLRDNTWANTGVAGRNQEIVYVASVATNTVSLRSSTIGAYATADTAELVKITPIVDAVVSGVEIVVPTGTNTGGGIYADVTAGCSVRNCKVTGPNDNAGVGFYRSTDFAVDGCRIVDGQAITSAGYAYAVEIGESSHCGRVTGCYQENVRESVATGRVRMVTFFNNVSRDSEDSHINTHGSWCDGVAIIGNQCNGGRYGYLAGYTTHLKADENVLIEGNIVRNTNSTGISVNSPSGKESSNISVVGNQVIGFGVTTTSYGILIGNTNRALVSGNSIDGMGNSAASYGILSTLAVDSTIQGNLVYDISNGYGIAVTDGTNVNVLNNSTHDISSHNFRTTGTNTGCSFRGNTADDTNVSLSACVVIGNSWQGPNTSVLTAADGDATPTVLGATHLLIPSNTGATAITQLDDAVSGQQVTIVATNATNPSTLADSGNFNLSAAWAPGVGDTITLFTTNGTAWVEVSRSDN